MNWKCHEVVSIRTWRRTIVFCWPRDAFACTWDIPKRAWPLTLVLHVGYAGWWYQWHIDCVQPRLFCIFLTVCCFPSLLPFYTATGNEKLPSKYVFCLDRLALMRSSLSICRLLWVGALLAKRSASSFPLLPACLGLCIHIRWVVFESFSFSSHLLTLDYLSKLLWIW